MSILTSLLITLIAVNGSNISLNEFSADRNNQDHYRIAFDEPSNTFGFYAAVQNITSGSKNKGRICIGDMTVYA